LVSTASVNCDECYRADGTPFGWSLANAIVFRKVRQALGLDRCMFACSGAAPMTKETQEFFLSYNIPIYDIYGMSESSGKASFF
jgi:long-chain-fatty-acid--CoA ligase ACSBG